MSCLQFRCKSASASACLRTEHRSHRLSRGWTLTGGSMVASAANPDEAALPEGAVSSRSELSLTALYDAHVAMVWRTLKALGVPETGIDDAVQDVFLVVHRRAAAFEARSSIKTWLF